VHVPLLVSAPGQQTRQDVYSPTNSVDVLSSLAHLAGRPAPDWAEGTLLPGLGGREDPQRSTFSVEAKSNPSFGELKQATVAMRKGVYKLIYYTGYEPQDSFELYDLESDPEELVDLYPAGPDVARSMSTELLDRFHRAGRRLG
jgi:arylsulfatase A-like enzyme